MIPARFSQSASALRYRAVVTARALSDAVLRAGGEPLTVHPWARTGQLDQDLVTAVGERLAFADGVLLPGGGDLAPARYGAEVAHGEVYDVDEEQDCFDLAVAAWALGAGVPVLGICRGTQVVNVARGGTMEQHMDTPHRDVVLPVTVSDPALAQVLGAEQVTVSCYHHQRLEQLGDGLAVAASAEDGTVEAVTAGELPGWFLGVQWHPEDTAATDPAQAALFEALVSQAVRYRTRRAA